MKSRSFCLSILFAFILSGTALGQQGVKTGIVKGIITIGGKPTSDAVVSIEGLPQEYLKSQISKLTSKKAEMDQQDMKFFPHVLPVLVGTTVDFPNHDKTWHNIFSTSETKKFDLGLYPPGKSRTVTFDKPGVVKILCNVHPSMEAYIVIIGHSFFSLPDKGGNYRIDSVSLGEYRLQVWHPELGTKSFPFKLVRAGEVLDFNVDLENQR